MANRRKRKLNITEEILIPSASRGNQRAHQVLNDQVADNLRTVKRQMMRYFPPAPFIAPAEEAVFDCDEHLTWDFSAIPSNEEIEQFLAAHRDEDKDPKECEKSRHRTFATLEHDSTLRAWTSEAPKFLDELLRLEGLRGVQHDRCPTCLQDAPQEPKYRCNDCFGGRLVCQECCLRVHCEQPFHRIKVWNGAFFARTTLQAIGQVIQLGHLISEACPAPAAGPQACLIIHTNGFHSITLQFCQCPNLVSAGDRTQQLLRAELYGTSLADPTTFCTFRVLEAFHALTLQSKITAYDYYMTLQGMTDMTGLAKQYDCLKPFLRVIQEWRFLKLLKRSGRGHVSDGVTSMAPGDLCLHCPACLRPGFNLPDNWDSVSDELRYMYLLILALDANFRLKRRTISNDAYDLGLMSECRYFVPDENYRDHVMRYADQEDISTCTGFAAMAYANTKFSKGYATTGVSLVLCTRHRFIQPNGIGDLQKGERYCNMDYIAMSALKIFGSRADTMLSYNIACQWEINIRRRVADDKFLDHLKIGLLVGRELRFVIPKYHFWGHTGKDHNKYSLNLVPGVGRANGEEIEQNWWRHDATAASTREMGPGSRHNTLEDHFQWSNFSKLVGLGKLLSKRLKTALLGFALHDRLFQEYSSGIEAQDTEA